MSATTAAPPRAGLAPLFAGILRSEARKLGTVRSTTWALLAAVAFSVITAALLGALLPGHLSAHQKAALDSVRVSLGGLAEGGRGLQVVNALAARWDCFLLADTRVVWCDFGQSLRAAPGDAWAWLRLVLPACDLSPSARPAAAVAPGALTGVAR